MEFETEKMCLNQLVAHKEEDFNAEDNIIIPDIKPDILSTINSSGNVYVYKKELSNGKLKIDGGVLVSIMYLSDDGDSNGVRGLNTIIDFSKSFDMDKIQEGCDCNCKINIKSIDCRILNGRKINISVNLSTDINIYSNEELSIIQSTGELSRAQMISNSLTINCLKGKGETVSIAKDTITLDSAINDILDTSIYVRNKDIKVSYNKVLSKADIVVEIMYSSTDGKIDVSSIAIPIMGFIDLEGIAEKDICTTEYEARNINIKPNNNDDNSVSIEIEFVICCRAYENREINLIEDIYSPEQDITIKQEQVNLIRNKGIIKDVCDVQNVLNIPELTGNKIYITKVDPHITKTNLTKNSLMLEGELNVQTFFVSNLSDQIESRLEKIPFTHEIKSDLLDKNNVLDIETEVVSKNFELVPDNKCNIDIEINLTIDTYRNEKIDIVSDVTIEDISKSNQGCRSSSLVIYYVKEGDTLWKIAKKFRSTIDEIASLNNIDNVDKLNIGEQLFIPKYVCNRIS